MEALYKLGELSVALAIVFVVFLIVRVIVQKKNGNSNGHSAIEVRVGTLEREVAGLREWRHDMNDAAQGIIARDHLNKKRGLQD